MSWGGVSRGIGVAVGAVYVGSVAPDDLTTQAAVAGTALFFSLFSRLGHGFGRTAVVFPRRLLRLALPGLDRALRVGDYRGPFVRPTAFGSPSRLDALENQPVHHRRVAGHELRILAGAAGFFRGIYLGQRPRPAGRALGFLRRLHRRLVHPPVARRVLQGVPHQPRPPLKWLSRTRPWRLSLCS